MDNNIEEKKAKLAEAYGEESAKTPPRTSLLGAGILSQLLVPASVMADITTQQELTTVPILKSSPRDAWSCAHPDHKVGPIAMVEAEVGDGRMGLYGVDRRLLADQRVAREVKAYKLQLAQTSDGHLFLWALREGNDSWAASAHAAAELATKGWVRVMSKSGSGRSGGRYEVISPEQNLNVDLVWPEMPFAEIVDLALKDRVIDSLDHAVLLRLRGAF